jgi:hypothetical protein
MPSNRNTDKPKPYLYINRLQDENAEMKAILDDLAKFKATLTSTRFQREHPDGAVAVEKVLQRLRKVG